ncbi:chalcone isomerase family protein [Pannonibacter carbonis]|uniref:chalcone isomerase family protein n=1 Tax=Pannonibacter carbonis TaxID=2067569 RepID=UPI000D0E4DEC|nr:chalcone isomerase family protein [Pannonibacter carbonis]
MTFVSRLLPRQMAMAFLACATLILTPLAAKADLGPASRLVPSAELVGKGRLTFFGFRIFDAELYAPDGVYATGKPFALKLTYLRRFSGEAIADRSIDEIRRQGYGNEAKLSAWSDAMRDIFPDVTPGQSITGVRDASGRTVFYSGNRRLGTIADPEFTRRFFAIWLGNNTQDPDLRARLTGIVR